MTDSITSSSELRQFATENDGRRKIDVLASLDLHKRAANQIDLLGEHITDLQKRLATAVAAPVDGGITPPTPMPAPVAAPAAGEEPGQAALMILQRAQDTAEQVLTEATQIRSEAERTRNEADALAKAKADAALAEARGQAALIIEAAQQRANEVADATAQVADRAAFNQSQFRNRAAGLRADAQSVVALAESMELAAGEDLPAAITQLPYTEPLGEPAAAPVVEPAAVEAAVPEAAPVPEVAAAPPVEAAPVEPVAVPEPAPIEEIVLDDAPAAADVNATIQAAAPPMPEPAPVASDLPPPPSAADVAALMDESFEEAAPAITDTGLPPAPDPALLPPPPSVEFAAAEAPAVADLGDKDVLDLTEGELEEVLGKSIDDELFDDDDAVIDLTEETASTNGQGFEFFSRD